jgi:hypothetical protein
VHLVTVAEEQANVTYIPQLRARGLSYSRISQRLTEAGVPSRSGHPCRAQSAYNIANRPAAYGVTTDERARDRNRLVTHVSPLSRLVVGESNCRASFAE